MTRRSGFVLLALALISAVALATRYGKDREIQSATAGEARIETGALDVWSTYAGRYESRAVQSIASSYAVSATLAELVPDGAEVERGAQLARLDTSMTEAEIVQKEEALTAAQSEFERLQKVAIPTESQDLSVDIVLAEDSVTGERSYLQDSEQLVSDGLLSAQELEQQRRKLQEQEAKLTALRDKSTRLAQVDRPARLRAAAARVRGAERALRSTQDQLLKAVIRAPAAGVAQYEPISISGEYRTVRPGDSVAPSQTFMLLTSLEGLQTRFELPESEIQRVSIGLPAVVQPLADAETKIQGTVSRISATAQTAPGYPVWQRFFQVVVDLPATGVRIRPGTAAVIHVLSHQRAAAILVPRLAVDWSEGAAYVQVRDGASWSRRQIQVGLADATRFEVVKGLIRGDTVLVPP